MLLDALQLSEMYTLALSVNTRPYICKSLKPDLNKFVPMPMSHEDDATIWNKLAIIYVVFNLRKRWSNLPGVTEPLAHKACITLPK